MGRVRVARVNSFSASSIPVPDAGRLPKVRPTTPKEIETARQAASSQRKVRVRRQSFEDQGGRPGRADVLPETPVGHGMTLSHFSAQGMLAGGVSAAHTLDAVRGTSMHADPAHLGTDSAGSGAKVPRTITQGTPDINVPHATHPDVVPARRWEDLHPDEQKRALQKVAQYGSSPEKMHADLRDQVLSAHARSGRNSVDTPFSARFYQGPSLQRDKIEEGADEVMAHPAAKAAGITREHARAMVAVANAATSPNVKFQQGDRFPNHDAAMHSVRHALAGGSPETVGRPANTGGVYPANLEKASHLASQMLGGRTVRDLTLPSGKKAFDPKEAPKTTDYAGAWIDPTGPDSRYVSDVHSTHSLMPHLSTAKSVTHQLPDGTRVNLHPFDKVPKGAVPLTEVKNGKTKIKTAGSESEQYLASDKVGLSALHDHIARNVAHELGLSHSPHNAGATHYLQASDWGEEQINRPDVHDRTEAVAYGRPDREDVPGHDVTYHVPAGGRIVTQPALSGQQFHHNDEDQTWSIGDQKRHEATAAKRRRQGNAPQVDPEARAQGW